MTNTSKPKPKIKIICRECKRELNRKKRPRLYFIEWNETADFTCSDCIETAYHQIKMDVANERRKK